MSLGRMVVLKELTVPEGKYCWSWGLSDDGVSSVDPAICQYFSNEGGHELCDELKTSLLRQKDTGYVLKCKGCLDLKKKTT